MAGKRAVGAHSEEVEVTAAEPAEVENDGGRSERDCFLFLVQNPRLSIGGGCVQRLLSDLTRLGFAKETPANCITFAVQCYGGDADAAFRLVRAIRGCCKRLEVLIPDSAKSAATLMALAADKVYMGIGSDLGPLDMQLEHPAGERISSALDGTHCLNDLQMAATMMAHTLVTRVGNEFWQTTRIPRRNVLDSLLRFASDTIEPIMRQIDPWMLHECMRLLDAMERYARTLLRDHMFAARKDGNSLAESVANRLVTDYPMHSYVILRDEARDELQLEVGDAEELEYWDNLCTMCRHIWHNNLCLCTASSWPLDFNAIAKKATSYNNAP